MAGPVPVIHFPEAVQVSFGLWKMDGRHEGGHDVEFLKAKNFMDKTPSFQTFDDRSDAATVAPRLAALRAELAKRGLDGFVVPHSDEYQSEYLPECNERLAWLTAFTGSAGAAVVLKDKAAVFVDGRYTLQVRQQTDTKLFDPRDLVEEGPNAWLEANAPKGAKIGYDPWVHTAASADALRIAAERAGATLVPTDGNPIDAVWHDRPAAPTAKAVPHAMNLAGESAESKRTRIAEDVKKLGADAAVVSLAGFDLLAAQHARRRHAAHAVRAVLRDPERRRLDRSVHGRAQDPRPSSPSISAMRCACASRQEFNAALDALKGKTVIADPTGPRRAAFDRLHKAGAT